MITKRTLLQGTVGAVTIFTGLVPGLREAAAQTLRVRRSVNTMALDDPDLETYRDFVGIMRARPATDLLSWVGYANQHGNATAFKYCPHGDWYFLPWHRAYVQMYENAAQVLTKNPKFAMPYWNWTTLRDYPQAFTDKTYKGKPNPLYVPGLGDDPTIVRNALTGPNALTDSLVGPDVMRRIYAETVYEVFGTSRSVDRSKTPPQVQNNLDPKWVPMGGGNQGILERTPHNNVHNNIGGYMPNSNSPRDPIFMMHHSNIDRIWAHWNALGRKNSTESLWLNMPFTNNFISPQGKLYTKGVRDVLSTQALGYTYDDLPKPDNKPVDLERLQNVAALFNPAAKSKAPRMKAANTLAARVDAPLNLQVPMAEAMLAPALTAVQEKKAPRDVVAILSDIKVGANVRSIRVFVNRPTVGPDVPDTDPHFVTTISFLAHGKGEHAGHGKSLPSTIVNLTETLQNLAKSKALPNDKVSVQLVPVPEPGAAPGSVGGVTPGAIEIAII